MNPNDFEQCPISNILMKICDLEPQQRCACDDGCAVLCLPFGLIIDVICMCPRYGIYICKKCNNKYCNKQIQKPTQPVKNEKQFQKPRFIVTEPKV